ncbi:MAG: helix-turn-helix transcriptional regulator [Oceanospirillales bacterium]|nr:helix-turn-helix transcriptional regulator [Oceanospirillales bacterium]
MKIDLELVKKLRADKAWSQEELAVAADLSLRTVQRIEKEGRASLESKKAIASAFGIKASNLDMKEGNSAFSDEASDSFYFRIVNGTQLAEVVGGAYAYRLNHDDPRSEDEADTLAWAAQSIKDWGEIWSDLEAGDRVKAAYDLSQLIQELGATGIWVFGLRTNEHYPGVQGDKWPVANIFLMREDNPKIIKLDLSNTG